MSYIGNQPTQQAFVTDQFSGTGSAVAFTMSVAPANTASVLVSVSGVLQDPSTYAVSGLTLTFSAAPPTGTGNISVRYLGIPASGVTTTAYRTVTEFTATSGQTSFSVPSYTVGFINVYRNGVRLGSADFTATNGTTVVLAVGAITGDLVVTESFYVSSVLNAIPVNGGVFTGQVGMPSAVFSGSTSGGVTVLATAIAGNTTLTLPATSGTVLTDNSVGYRYVQTLYFTSSSTFSKATYPWLRGIRVRCVGGGGGGGGITATAAGDFVASAGGGGGGYAESFITDITGLASSVTITRGAGGAGGVAGANSGTAGGNSSFGSAVIGNGATGGGGQVAYSFWLISTGGVGGSGTGDLVITGGSGLSGNNVNTNGGYGGAGGATVLGMTNTPAISWQSSNAGYDGNLYGTGGSGAASGQSQTAKAGGNGAAGIVILELFA